MSPRVLLTGANGFVGSHILDQLLLNGYSVRSVVRSQAKADQVRSDFPSAKDKLDFAVVPDITMPGAFDVAVQSAPPFEAVIHTASPFLMSMVSNNLEFLNPAIHGTTEILKSVKGFAPSVKRVIITSSFAAVHGGPPQNGVSYTEADWNPVTWEQALVGPKGSAYVASKKLAEKAAWDFMQEKKPGFDLVVMNPPMIYGPLRHTIRKPAELNESNLRIYKAFFQSSKDAPMPPNGLPLYTDVRDLATAHLNALTNAEAANKRFLVCAGRVASQEIADILRSNIPELAERVPVGKPGSDGLEAGAMKIDNSRVRELLGVSFTSVESTFADLGKQCIELEKKEAAGGA
ncbi:MAG: methylglyoxal reductase (NADPH-dependent) gre2 [Trizodia sp. TS-e1964]|nr:MAG: methylglyoxal reductase (NADPH-dependent) gre2 [Trizodia sp. TS-e1964]